jgi:hypothetical protein
LTSISSQCLGGVQSLIRLFDKVCDFACSPGEGGYSDADCDLSAARQPGRYLRDRLPDTFGQFFNVVSAKRHDCDAEFPAAISADQVPGTTSTLEKIHQAHQDFVADNMTTTIVDALGRT